MHCTFILAFNIGIIFFMHLIGKTIMVAISLLQYLHVYDNKSIPKLVHVYNNYYYTEQSLSLMKSL